MATTDAADPLDHPDMRLLGERLGAQIDDVLAAEQHAARVAAQRRTSLRDRLVRAEDMCLGVSIVTPHGTYEGVIAAVGTDHVVLDGPRSRVVALDHVVAFEVDP